MLDTRIVVPCYNEASRLDCDAFRRFASRYPRVGFLFVDDGSRDATLDVLARVREGLDQQIEILSLPVNQGKAEAVRCGMLRALEDRSPRAVGFWDADLATPLEAIPLFCSVLDRREEIAIVIGSRMPLMGRCIDRRPMRKLLGRLFAGAVHVALGLPLRDTQCGAKLFRAGPALRDIFAQRFISRWIFDVEILARWLSMADQSADPRAAIYELPLESWRDVAGSRLTGGDFLQAAGDLLSIGWRYRTGSFRPALAPGPSDSGAPMPRPESDHLPARGRDAGNKAA